MRRDHTMPGDQRPVSWRVVVTAKQVPSLKETASIDIDGSRPLTYRRLHIAVLAAFPNLRTALAASLPLPAQHALLEARIGTASSLTSQTSLIETPRTEEKSVVTLSNYDKLIASWLHLLPPFLKISMPDDSKRFLSIHNFGSSIREIAESDVHSLMCIETQASSTGEVGLQIQSKKNDLKKRIFVIKLSLLPPPLPPATRWHADQGWSTRHPPGQKSQLPSLSESFYSAAHNMLSMKRREDGTPVISKDDESLVTNPVVVFSQTGREAPKVSIVGHSVPPQGDDDQDDKIAEAALEELASAAAEYHSGQSDFAEMTTRLSKAQNVLVQLRSSLVGAGCSKKDLESLLNEFVPATPPYLLGQTDPVVYIPKPLSLDQRDSHAWIHRSIHGLPTRPGDLLRIETHQAASPLTGVGQLLKVIRALEANKLLTGEFLGSIFICCSHFIFQELPEPSNQLLTDFFVNQVILPLCLRMHSSIKTKVLPMEYFEKVYDDIKRIIKKPQIYMTPKHLLRICKATFGCYSSLPTPLQVDLVGQLFLLQNRKSSTLLTFELCERILMSLVKDDQSKVDYSKYSDVRLSLPGCVECQTSGPPLLASFKVRSSADVLLDLCAIHFLKALRSDPPPKDFSCVAASSLMDETLTLPTPFPNGTEQHSNPETYQEIIEETDPITGTTQTKVITRIVQSQTTRSTPHDPPCSDIPLSHLLAHQQALREGALGTQTGTTADGYNIVTSHSRSQFWQTDDLVPSPVSSAGYIAAGCGIGTETKVVFSGGGQMLSPPSYFGDASSIHQSSHNSGVMLADSTPSIEHSSRHVRDPLPSVIELQRCRIDDGHQIIGTGPSSDEWSQPQGEITGRGQSVLLDGECSKIESFLEVLPRDAHRVPHQSSRSPITSMATILPIHEKVFVATPRPTANESSNCNDAGINTTKRPTLKIVKNSSEVVMEQSKPLNDVDVAIHDKPPGIASLESTGPVVLPAAPNNLDVLSQFVGSRPMTSPPRVKIAKSKKINQKSETKVATSDCELPGVRGQLESAASGVELANGLAVAGLTPDTISTSPTGLAETPRSTFVKEVSSALIRGDVCATEVIEGGRQRMKGEKSKSKEKEVPTVKKSKALKSPERDARLVSEIPVEQVVTDAKSSDVPTVGGGNVSPVVGSTRSAVGPNSTALSPASEPPVNRLSSIVLSIAEVLPVISGVPTPEPSVNQQTPSEVLTRTKVDKSERDAPKVVERLKKVKPTSTTVTDPPKPSKHRSTSPTSVMAEGPSSLACEASSEPSGNKSPQTSKVERDIESSLAAPVTSSLPSPKKAKRKKSAKTEIGSSPPVESTKLSSMVAAVEQGSPPTSNNMHTKGMSAEEIETRPQMDKDLAFPGLERPTEVSTSPLSVPWPESAPPNGSHVSSPPRPSKTNAGDAKRSPLDPTEDSLRRGASSPMNTQSPVLCASPSPIKSPEPSTTNPPTSPTMMRSWKSNASGPFSPTRGILGRPHSGSSGSTLASRVSPKGQSTATTPVGQKGQSTTTTPVGQKGQSTTTTPVGQKGQSTTTTPVGQKGQSPATTPVGQKGQSPATTPVTHRLDKSKSSIEPNDRSFLPLRSLFDPLARFTVKTQTLKPITVSSATQYVNPNDGSQLLTKSKTTSVEGFPSRRPLSRVGTSPVDGILPRPISSQVESKSQNAPVINETNNLASFQRPRGQPRQRSDKSPKFGTPGSFRSNQFS